MEANKHQLMKAVVQIEEMLNAMAQDSKGLMYKISSKTNPYPESINEDKFSKIDKMMRQINDERKDFQFVNRRLLERGYEKNGKPDYARFQSDAMIDSGVWSRYKNGECQTSHNTFLKIVIGLRLNEQEAHDYLILVSDGFHLNILKDRIILSFIKLDYLGETQTIQIINSLGDILNYYSSQEVGAGRNSLRLYDL